MSQLVQTRHGEADDADEVFVEVSQAQLDPSSKCVTDAFCSLETNFEIVRKKFAKRTSQ